MANTTGAGGYGVDGDKDDSELKVDILTSTYTG